MEAEIRNGKYYIKLIDGEIELTQEEIKEHMELHKQTMRYIETGLKYAKNGNWTVGSVPKSFDSIVAIDMFIENLLMVFELGIKQGENQNDFRSIIDLLICKVDEDISNPLKKDQKELYEYELKKLNGLLPYINFQPQPNDSEQQQGKTQSQKNSNIKEQYSHKVIAIACLLLNKPLNNIDDAEKVLKMEIFPTANKSAEKLLQHRVTSISDLSKIRADKTANTKHLKSLLAVKQILSGKKNKTALNSITTVIAAFEANRTKQDL